MIFKAVTFFIAHRKTNERINGGWNGIVTDVKFDSEGQKSVTVVYVWEM